jgi:hypothetical protein
VCDRENLMAQIRETALVRFEHMADKHQLKGLKRINYMRELVKALDDDISSLDVNGLMKCLEHQRLKLEQYTMMQANYGLEYYNKNDYMFRLF